MITGIFILTFLVLAVLYGYNKVDLKDASAGRIKHLIIAVAIGLAGLVASLVQPFTLERVDAGHVGIKVKLTGDSRGISKFEYRTGWVIVNNWVERLYEFPTFQQHIDYPDQQVITSGGFSANIKPSFNYSLKPGEIGNMFQSLRLDIKRIEQEWLQTAIVGTVNDVANQWLIDDIFNQREKFETAIITEANRRVAKYFQISQLRTNIVPPKELQQSIIAKTQSVQEVQVAQQQRLVAIAEGDRKVATARADSAAKVIDAAADAEVIRLKQLRLTPEYNQYLWIQKWNGQVPQVQSGGSGMLLNVSPK